MAPFFAKCYFGQWARYNSIADQYKAVNHRYLGNKIARRKVISSSSKLSCKASLTRFRILLKNSILRPAVPIGLISNTAPTLRASSEEYHTRVDSNILPKIDDQ